MTRGAHGVIGVVSEYDSMMDSSSNFVIRLQVWYDDDLFCDVERNNAAHSGVEGMK